ncbi:cyclin-P isoform X2 [Xiphophorus couchianus]|uniref:cyclin-P isoform X2 n=1 Tax=Xiphophorus couchianus TaxID=32473 RepID=UPI0010169A8A|nr:G2/mitotic-specific cyclin cdc13-like isoform X2 [Xiphophorus couchianus]
MARTGFCDSKALLDLHKKADERRAPLRTWTNACGPIDRFQPVEVEESRTAPVKMEPESRWERRPSTHTSEVLIMGFHEDSRTCKADCCVEAPVLLYPHGMQGLHSLHTLVPSLLKHEVEMALENLDLIWDRTYAWDMFLDMMKTQMQYSFPNADLPRQFTDATRAILIEWIIQVHELLQFQEETLYLAIHLLNHSLRQLKVSVANLQLLGMVCLFLAAKKEESLLPEVSALCSLMDHTYTKHQLLRMERKVLCALKFDLSFSPPLHFLLLFASVARCSATVKPRRVSFSTCCCMLVESERSLVPTGGVDGSLSTRTLSARGPVCGVSACTAGWRSPLLGPPSSTGMSNARGRGCMVSGFQHPCWQVCNLSIFCFCLVTKYVVLLVKMALHFVLNLFVMLLFQ